MRQNIKRLVGDPWIDRSSLWFSFSSCNQDLDRESRSRGRAWEPSGTQDCHIWLYRLPTAQEHPVKTASGGWNPGMGYIHPEEGAPFFNSHDQAIRTSGVTGGTTKELRSMGLALTINLPLLFFWGGGREIIYKCPTISQNQAYISITT